LQRKWKNVSGIINNGILIIFVKLLLWESRKSMVGGDFRIN
jgi:hypothetical protein